jgi:hypothetical protein
LFDFGALGFHGGILSQASLILSYNYAVPNKPNPAPEQRKVGDKIKVNMHAGKIVDATIKAIIDSTDGVKYQVDFVLDQTVLIHEWQLVK